MPGLPFFPEELLCKISDFIHPQTIVDWARTCKVFSRCSLQALKYYKHRQSELRVVHDRNPITIPSLLREGYSKPETLWYIRSLDIWDLRETFEQWKSPHFTKGNRFDEDSEQSLDWPEKHHDYSHLDTTFYNDKELEHYYTILSEKLHLRKPLVDEWIALLRSGSDEPLKLLLMALSPKLTKVTFVEYRRSLRTVKEDHPLRWLVSTLRALAPLPNPKWPCFQNLKIVYVGYYTELRNYHGLGGQGSFFPRCSAVAPLLLLPAIEELHLNLLMAEEDGRYPKPYIWAWEEGRSSCKKLTGSE